VARPVTEREPVPPSSSSVIAPVSSAGSSAAIASVGTPSAKPTGSPRSSASGLARPGPSSSVSAPGSALAAVAPVASYTGGPHFKLALSAPGNCAANSECSALLTLTATEGYHINKNEYPYKFIADEASGVVFTKDARSFGTASGDFTLVNESVATVRISFKAASAFTLQGTFKMSVCSEANCQVEVQRLALNVPIR
jgi:hypothetical protein